MDILIDGYNLLNAANIVARGPGPYTLAKSRRSLLEHLVRLLSAEERSRTTVVFDGREAPAGLERHYTFQQMTVHFSARRTEADDLLEQLIQRHHAPRRLVVVSSDHRVQRAARRRQARAIDSELWHRQRVAKWPGTVPHRPSHDAKPVPTQLSEDEVAMWLDEFGSLGKADPAGNRQQPTEQVGSDPSAVAPDRPEDQDVPTIDHPFPQGYGEDLLDERE
jgi:predicted RNA-binding protein with PIN domain